MSVATLAKKVGVSRSAVSQWETGDTKGLKPVNLLRCADALGVTVRLLVTGDDRSTAGAELAERVSALPVALREYLLVRVTALEEAAREIPFAFHQPLDKQRSAEFHEYLEKITRDRDEADEANREPPKKK